MDKVLLPSLRIVDLTALLFPAEFHPDWSVRFNPSIARITGPYFLVSYRLLYDSSHRSLSLSWQEVQQIIQGIDKYKDALRIIWDEFIDRVNATNILSSFITYVRSPAYTEDTAELAYLPRFKGDKVFNNFMLRIFSSQPNMIAQLSQLRGRLAPIAFSSPLFRSYVEMSNAYEFFVTYIHTPTRKPDPVLLRSYNQTLEAFSNFQQRVSALAMTPFVRDLTVKLALYSAEDNYTLNLPTGENDLELPYYIMRRYEDEVERKGHLPWFHPSRMGFQRGVQSSELAIVAITENKRNSSYDVRLVKRFSFYGLNDIRLIRDEEEFKLGPNEFVFLASGDNTMSNYPNVAARKILVSLPNAPPLTKLQEANITLISQPVTKTGGICASISPQGRNWTPFWLDRRLFFNFSFLPHKVIGVNMKAKTEKLSSSLVTPSEDEENLFPTNLNFEDCRFLPQPKLDLTIPDFYRFRSNDYRFSLGTPALPWSTSEYIAVGHSRFNSRLRKDLPHTWTKKPSVSPVDTKNYSRLLDEFIAPQQEKIEENAAFYYYFAFFFTFDAKTMAITSMSHSLLFETHMPFLVDFPVGLEHAFPNDDAKADVWIVSYGEGDMRMKLAFMSRKDIERLLVPIKEMMVGGEFHKFLLLTHETEEVRKRKKNPLMTPRSKKTG